MSTAELEGSFLYFIGTAGAGKSSLAGAFHEWITRRGLDAVLVNLDPGAERLPYAPDVDVRDWVSLRTIMSTEGLGPNGAQIAACDLLALQSDKIRTAIEQFRSPYILLDTPGQIELFVFRPSGRHLIQSLQPERSLLAFLIDPFVARTPSGLASELLLATSVQFRMGVPTAHLLSKTDLLTEEEITRIRSWTQDVAALERAFDEEEAGLHREMNLNVARVIDGLGALPSLLPTSATNFEGLEDLYTHVQQALAGGDDLLSD